jgi:exopolyphosphatase / guanosine-5'-triphosphate,3'-diphosphate pyrophosphatase
VDETFSACIDLGRSYGFEEEHSRQDAHLALRLFDLTADLHGLDEELRGLLHCAALLHDIGYVEGYWGHHKTAHRLIMAAHLPGLTEREKRIVANIARYHRGARPSAQHTGFASLDSEDRELVRILGAILRLADGLDRSHTDAVRDLDARLVDDQLILLVDCPFDCAAEIWAAEKKGRFLGDLLGLQVSIRQRMESWD